MASNETGATPSALAAGQLRVDENKFELYPYSGQGPTREFCRSAMPMMLPKIVSGAETGVDRGAEDRRIPEQYP
jgi:hypothetical protein